MGLTMSTAFTETASSDNGLTPATETLLPPNLASEQTQNADEQRSKQFEEKVIDQQPAKSNDVPTSNVDDCLLCWYCCQLCGQPTNCCDANLCHCDCGDCGNCGDCDCDCGDCDCGDCGGCGDCGDCFS